MDDAPASPVPPEPAPPKFRFKPREFPVENVPVSAPSTQGPTDVQGHFRAAAAGNPSLTPTPGPPPENEIHGILRANVAHAGAAGLNEVKPVARRPSRRLRDYLIVAGAYNLFLGAVAWKFREAPVMLVFVLAAFVLFNLRLAWSMWVVMDDY